MSLDQTLLTALDTGHSQIGQLRIIQDHSIAPFLLYHLDDEEKVTSGELSTLSQHRDPDAARELSLYTPDGDYRFNKAELSLPAGWIFLLENIAQLRRTLDLFYPAALGLWSASQDGTLRIQHLRDKLNRQSGMYRHSRNVTDQGAQHLVKTLCGPANKCVKKILWQLDASTPLDDSEASRFNGTLPDQKAIPLLCQEACNFFVAECRKQSKKEFEDSPS